MHLWLLLACSGDPEPAVADGPRPDSGATGTVDTADTGTPSDQAGWQVAPATEAGLHTPFLARDPQGGALYATWGERGNDGFTRIWLAASSDDGRTFSDPVQISASLQDATASWPEGPALAVGPEHLYVVYGAHELGGAPYAMYVQKGPLPSLPAGPTPGSVPVELERATRIEQPSNWHSINYPTLAIHPDGEAWLALIASPQYDGRVWVAREGVGWAIEDVTETSPLSEPPCECCPPALAMDPSGRVLVGWRGDIDKDLFLAESDGSTPFTAHRKITDTDVEGLLCPQDGMQFVHHEGAMHLAWSDTRPALARGFLSTEGSDGSWSHVPILTDSDEVQTRLAVVPTDAGLLTHWDVGWGTDARMAVVGSAAGQGVRVAGVGPLAQLRSVATPSGPVGIGVAEDGSLWTVALTETAVAP